MIGLVDLDEVRSVAVSLHTCSEKHSEDTGRRWLSANQDDSPHQNLTILAPGSWPSSLQSHEKINVCCLSHSVYDILLWQPKLTRTSYGGETNT